MSRAEAETQQEEACGASATPLVILASVGVEALSDGVALAAALGARTLSLRGGREVPPLDQVEQALADPPPLVLLATEADNLEQVLRLCKAVPAGAPRLLFGRQLSDPHLRQRVPGGAAEGLVVGEPASTCRALLRRLGGGAVELPRLAGLWRGNGADFVARAPIRDLDRLPCGSYLGLEQEAAFCIALQASRGYPRPCLFNAHRVWEQPVRRLSPERVADQLEQLAGQVGAWRVRFTDQCLNTSSQWLEQVAQQILLRPALRPLRWSGRLWADSSLDRPLVNLLRRSGCRGVELDLWSGAPQLARQYATGVDVDQAARLARRLDDEGIAVHLRLVVGLPGESARHRAQTLAWIERCAGWLRSVRHAPRCQLRQGAPARQQAGVVLMHPTDPDAWHDGGQNTSSARRTWQRELATWCQRLGVWPADAELVPLPQPVAEAAEQRLRASVQQQQLRQPGWAREHAAEAGLLNGAHAARGPRRLELEWQAPWTEQLDRLLEQAAQLGCRRLLLDHSAATSDPCMETELLRAVERARALDLSPWLRLRFDRVARPDALEPLAEVLCGMEGWAPDEAAWRGAVAGLGWLGRWRRQQLATRPRLGLRVALAGAGPPLDELRRELARLELDWLDLDAGWDQARGAPAELAAELHDWIGSHGLTGRGVAEQGPLPWAMELVGQTQPEGFRLSAQGQVPTARCPAGVDATHVFRLPSDPCAVQAQFDRAVCRRCRLLGPCPVDRLDGTVRLSLLQLRGVPRLLRGAPAAPARDPRQPCYVGWEEARISARGQLLVCPECGVLGAGDVLEQGLEPVWHSQALTRFRQLAARGARALPLVDRGRCLQQCRRVLRDEQLARSLGQLTPRQREVLAAALGAARPGATAG